MSTHSQCFSPEILAQETQESSFLIQASLEATEILASHVAHAPSIVKVQRGWAFPGSQGLSQAHTVFVLDPEAELSPWFYPLVLPLPKALALRNHGRVIDCPVVMSRV